MSTSARTLSERKLRIETLEQKQLLAGDVLVNVVNGALNIQGDDLDNQIAVSSGEEPGTYIVRGLNGTNVMTGEPASEGGVAEGTAPESAVVVEGVRRGIRANMGDGNDTVILGDLNVRRSVSINTGDGDDNVLVGVGQGDEPGSIPAGTAGDDNADSAVAIRGNLNISTGTGADTIAINNTTTGGGLRLSAGADDDTVRIGRADAVAEKSLGENPVEGDDQVNPEADVRFRRGMRVNLGLGDDNAAIRDTHTRWLAVNGGGGDDNIRLNGVHARTLAVHGGRGDGADTVSISDSTTRVLFAALGGGDDTLNLGGVRAQLALLAGGGETDTLNLLGENRIRRQRAVGFDLGAQSEDSREPSLT